MKYIICMIFACLLGACAHKDTPDEGLSIASIPQGCAIYKVNGIPSTGYHQFGLTDSSILWVRVLDCGVRENAHCFYYIHDPDSFDPNFKTATRCGEK